MEHVHAVALPPYINDCTMVAALRTTERKRTNEDWFYESMNECVLLWWISAFNRALYPRSRLNEIIIVNIGPWNLNLIYFCSIYILNDAC